MGNYTVYCHTNKKNNKKYVGATSQSVLERWQNGKHYKRHKNFYNDIVLYGWNNFTHEILYTNLTKKQAEKIEADIIKNWHLTDKKYGYNVRNGGKLNKLSPKAIEKLKERNKGENNPFFNKQHSEETKVIMSERKPKRKVICIETKNIYNSTREAERKTDISHSDIIKCCKGKQNTAGNFHWKYLEEVV